MKTYLAILFACISIETFSSTTHENEESDTVSSVKFSAKVLIASSGFAPIPAFSFNKPLLLAFLNINKDRFTYEPDFAVGFNGKPWMINNWFRLNFLNAEIFIVGGGINPSLFFQDVSTDNGESTIQAQRNFSFDLSAEMRISEKSSLQLLYMRNNGCDPGTLSGNFFNVSLYISPLSLSKRILFHLRSEMFYFRFGEMAGVFGSATARVSHERKPISVFFQCVTPVWVNFSGIHVKANAGIMYSL